MAIVAGRSVVAKDTTLAWFAAVVCAGIAVVAGLWRAANTFPVAAGVVLGTRVVVVAWSRGQGEVDAPSSRFALLAGAGVAVAAVDLDAFASQAVACVVLGALVVVVAGFDA